MRVDMLNTYLDGGAGIAAQRLHTGLLAVGVDSRLWYARPGRNAECLPAAKRWDWKHGCSSPTGSGGRLLERLRSLRYKWQLNSALRGRRGDREIFTAARLGRRTPIANPMQGDVLHLHWVAKMIDYPSFFASLPADLPVVWTLHDMNPLTGGCHHADECTHFTSCCGDCPQLGRPGSIDYSRQAFRIKQDAYAGRTLHIVTPSRWLEGHVRRSALLGGAASIQTIHNGLDTKLFAPRDRQSARHRFDLPPDRLVIGFAAASLDNRRKGFSELLQSLSLLRHPEKFMGLAMGKGNLPVGSKVVPQLRSTGYLNDPQHVADFYSALDVFVITSMAENMPQTVVEALACGVPVVAFGVGGIPEVVQPHRSGLLAPLGDCRRVAEHIDWLAEHAEARRRLGMQGRQLIVEEFDQAAQTARYVELYRRVLQKQCRRTAA